jgi:ribosomal protein S18 acetylase RimI-like enzyme
MFRICFALRSGSKKLNRNIFIRPIEKSEYGILEDFLYAAIHIPPGAEPVPRNTIFIPEVYVYIEDFGKPGDVCFLAEIGGRLIGAAWSRILACPGKRGYGNIDERTPELAISVLPEYRGQGIGTRLLSALHDGIAGRGDQRISLSVQKTNPAVRLYERLGYAIIVESENAEDYIMIKTLRNNQCGAVSIKIALRDDIYDIALFLDECWRAEYAQIVAAGDLDRMSVDERYEGLCHRYDERMSEFLMFRDDKGIGGAAVAGKSFTDGYPDDGEISAIYLRSDMVGKGMGHTLFAEAERCLRDQGCTNFVLDLLSDNTGALRFYHAHGYQIVGNNHVRIGAGDYPVTVMRKCGAVSV